MLTTFDRDEEAIRFIEALPPHLRSHGRIRLVRAVAALATGDLDSVERYFEGEVDIANIRENETKLSDLWFALHAARLAQKRGVLIEDALRWEVHDTFPPPARFDFRLNAELS